MLSQRMILESEMIFPLIKHQLRSQQQQRKTLKLFYLLSCPTLIIQIPCTRQMRGVCASLPLTRQPYLHLGDYEGRHHAEIFNVFLLLFLASEL